VYFTCWWQVYEEVLSSVKVSGFIIHRRSQGGPKGPWPPPKIFGKQSFCALRGVFPNKIVVIRLKSNILDPQNFPPPHIFGLATPLLSYPQNRLFRVFRKLYFLLLRRFISRKRLKFMTIFAQIQITTILTANVKPQQNKRLCISARASNLWQLSFVRLAVALLSEF